MKKIKFQKYNSIENSYRTKYINYIKEQGYGNITYECREKIHGSCMSMYIDNTEIRWAKRSQLLSPDDNFNNLLRYKSEIELKVKKLFDYLVETEDINELIVYGEAIGGHYNHPEVEKNKLARKIQGGVNYHPDNLFVPFDMRINGEYISGELFDKYCNMFSIKQAPLLFIGSLTDCMNFSPIFETYIPSMYNLPKIESNFAEGVVIKPCEPVMLGDSRLILKNKHPNFSEITKSKGSKKEEIELDPKIVHRLEQIEPYINNNRLNNVLSKLGQVTDKQFGLVLRGLAEDAYDDFHKDNVEGNYDPWDDGLSSKEITLLNKQFKKICSAFIRDRFLNIVDGIYNG